MHHQPDGTAGGHPDDQDNKGQEMTSTTPNTIVARLGLYVAATTIMAGLTIGAAATAGADRVWDLDVFDKCIASSETSGYTYFDCCWFSGGEWNDEIDDCVAPAPLQNPQGQTGQTTTPPVLQDPPGQPSNPLIPVPRGPNSGTVG